MSHPEDEVLDIDFDQPDDEDGAHIDSMLVHDKSCEHTGHLPLIELLTKGLAEVVSDLTDPSKATQPADSAAMAEFAQQAFEDGRPVTISLTVMPSELLKKIAEQEDGEDKPRLLN